nr:pyridine nucleotide-disulfide oxidoreductase [Nocardia macrotermitis]
MHAETVPGTPGSSGSATTNGSGERRTGRIDVPGAASGAAESVSTTGYSDDSSGKRLTGRIDVPGAASGAAESVSTAGYSDNSAEQTHRTPGRPAEYDTATDDSDATRARHATMASTEHRVLELSDSATIFDPPATLRVRGLINATGTWEKPFVPYYPDAGTFAGRQLHAHDYRNAEEFAGRHVVVVGAGISAVQLLDEISRVTTTTWTSRTEPRWRTDEFSRDAGRRAVAMVEDRVRRGLPPRSVVSVTGLPVTDRIRAARARGVMDWHPMFSRIEPDGVRWADGTPQPADVILWATGFRSALDHLAPLRLRGPGGGITMTGRLATQVAADPRIHLLGYGPSASTIGANRAGRAAAVELTEHLGLRRV